MPTLPDPAPAPRPPVRVELDWTDRHRFAGRVRTGEGREIAVAVDGEGHAGLSPVQALAVGLAGCMATDVVDILLKGRHRLEGLRARLTGERRPEPPTRFVRFDLHLEVEGDVPPQAVERAVALSRESYCSVWHTLRPDLELRITHREVPGRRSRRSPESEGPPPAPLE